MKKNFTKIISLLLIIGMNWSAISLIAGTDAYFNDLEMSENNALTAGVLDFSLYSAADFTPQITPIQNSTRIIEVVDNSTMDYSYRVRVENPVGVLCDYLYLEDGVSGAPQALSAFISDEVLFSEKAIWTFDASLDNLGFLWQGEECQFDFVFEGWQDNMVYGAGGFSDVERISNMISNGDQPPVPNSCMKINEVYYNVSEFRGDDPNDEWIELYNSCEDEVNLQNWYLEDDQGQSYREIIHSSYDIEPGQFVVIAANASTWAYWPNIPTNAFKIALGGTKLFDGLSNSGDVIILYDDLGNQIDEVSWENNITGLDPAVTNVTRGHSISRNPKGYDTDAASDWMDTYDSSNPTGPNPGTNPHSEDGTLLPLSPVSSTPEPIIPDLMTSDDDGTGDADDTITDDDIIDTTTTDDTDDDDDATPTDTTDGGDTTDTGDDTDDTDDGNDGNDGNTTDDDDTDDDTGDGTTGDGVTDDDTTNDVIPDDTSGSTQEYGDNGAVGDTGDNTTDDADDGDSDDTTDDTTDADDTTDDTDDDIQDTTDGADTGDSDTGDGDDTQTDTQDAGDGDVDAGNGDENGNGDTGEETKPEIGGDDTIRSIPEDGADGDADGDADDK